MDLELTETQEHVRLAARDFATRAIAPKAREIDEKERFPEELIRGLGELGLLAVNVPDDVGGSGAGVVSYGLAMQEIAAACASTAVTMAVTNMVGEVISAFGTPEQRQAYCPKLASAEYLAGAFALSEAGAGSDPGAMRTVARDDGDSWVIDGGRIGISCQALGIARAALEESVRYARDRRAFDRSIGEFQAIQWKLADMKTELDAAHLLAMRAAWLKEEGRPFSREASMAKLFASEAANRIVNHAVQIHGGYGYIREFAAERHLRDARVTTIYEGTSEVQRLVIARSVLSP